MEPDQVCLQLGNQVIVVLLLLKMTDLLQLMVYLATGTRRPETLSYRTSLERAHLTPLVEVDEPSPDVIGVAVGDEGEILEEDSDVWNGRHWSDAQLVPVVLVVRLERGSETTPTRDETPPTLDSRMVSICLNISMWSLDTPSQVLWSRLMGAEPRPAMTMAIILL